MFVETSSVQVDITVLEQQIAQITRCIFEKPVIIDAHGLKKRHHLFHQCVIVTVSLGVFFLCTCLIVPCDQVQMFFQSTKNTEVHILVVRPHTSAAIKNIQHVVAAHQVWGEFKHMYAVLLQSQISHQASL